MGLRTGPRRRRRVLLPKIITTVYIKRVVGLPGDHSDEAGPASYQRRSGCARALARFSSAKIRVGRARRPGRAVARNPSERVSHETLDCIDNGFTTTPTSTPCRAGHFFMLGDNRDNSTDSRVLSQIGYVPLENIIGRAGMIYFSVGSDAAGTGQGFDRAPGFDRSVTFISRTILRHSGAAATASPESITTAACDGLLRLTSSPARNTARSISA